MNSNVKKMVFMAGILFLCQTMSFARMVNTGFMMDQVMAIGGGIEYQYASKQNSSNLVAMDATAMYGIFSLISGKIEVNSGFIFIENSPYVNIICGVGSLLFFVELGYYQIINEVSSSGFQIGFSGTLYGNYDVGAVTLFTRYTWFDEDKYSNRLQVGIKLLYNFKHKRVES